MKVNIIDINKEEIMSKKNLYGPPFKPGDSHFINEMRRKQEEESGMTLRATKKYDDILTLIINGDFDLAETRMNGNNDLHLRELLKSVKDNGILSFSCPFCSEGKTKYRNSIFICDSCHKRMVIDRTGGGPFPV